MEQREANGLIGVTFTAEEFEAVRIWVEGLAQQGSIVATSTRLYLPVGSSYMTTVEPGDTIWYDDEYPGPNGFSVERG